MFDLIEQEEGGIQLPMEQVDMLMLMMMIQIMMVITLFSVVFDIQVQAKLSLLSEGEAGHSRRQSSLHPSLAASPLPPTSFPEPLPYPGQPHSPYQQWTEPLNQMQGGLAGGYAGEEQPMGQFPNQGGGTICLLFEPSYF